MDEQRLQDILRQDVEVPGMVNKKLENTYSQLERKERPAKRKGPRPLRMVLIAAVLAAGCLLSVAAGLPAQVYNFLGGGSSLVVDGRDMALAVADEALSPIVLKDGRLWFVNGEAHTDVTSLIDEKTPYIYEHTDPITGNRGYVILGGTVDDFGWAEVVDLGDGPAITGINFGYDIHAPGVLDGDIAALLDENGRRLWLRAAMDQFGIAAY